MKIGLLAYSSSTGLGYQTKAFANNIECEKILVADLSKMNGMPLNPNWYYQPRYTAGIPTDEDIKWLLEGMDIVFVCETPLNWKLFKFAREMGVKTVLQYNYEFLEYIKKPNLPAPDVLASPSFWEMLQVEALNIAPVEYLPVPIDLRKFPYREISEVQTIIHVMGRAAFNDRNGTMLFLLLAQKMGIKNKHLKFKLFAQKPTDNNSERLFFEIKKRLDETKSLLGGRFTVIFDVAKPSEMYEDGEIMVLPRRYGGLCLPLWEAMACGIPVIMPDISPNDEVLPLEWLADAVFSSYAHTKVKIPLYHAELDSLIERTEALMKNIVRANHRARELAEGMCWNRQKKNFFNLFKNIL